MPSALLRAPLQLVTSIFLAGSCLLLFFILLAGSSKSDSFLNKWYWLTADTSNIDGTEYPVSRWSMYGRCGYEKGDSVKKPGNFMGCTKNKADYPMDPKRNFGLSKDNVWDEFKGNKYYYMSRFQYPFYIIALFFNVVALFSSLASVCSSIVWGITTMCVVLATIFAIAAASLSTATYVMARNVFHKYNTAAEIAPTLYGFAWAVVAMGLLNLIFMFAGCGGSSSRKNKAEKDQYDNSGSYQNGAYNSNYNTTNTNNTSGAYNANAGYNADSYKMTSQKATAGTGAGASSSRGGFKFGGPSSNKVTTTTVVDDKDASSFVRG